MKTKKIIKVLEFIKEKCKSYSCDGCYECPFSDESGGCIISVEKHTYNILPEDWDIEIIKSNLKDKERIK